MKTESVGKNREAFVGRRRELQRLETCVDAVLDGMGRIVTIRGPGGIGKTRLLREFVASVPRDRISVGNSRAYEGEESGPLAVWDQLARSLNVAATKRVSISGPSAGLSWKPGGGDISANAFVPSLWERVTRAVVDYARRYPTLLSIDNAQWADTPSLRVLNHLAQLIGEIPLLIVVTYRPEEVGRRPVLQQVAVELAKSANHLDIALSPLSADDVHEYLVRTVRSLEPLAPFDIHSAARKLYDRSEGNPLYMVELVRSGALVDRHNHGKIHLPETLEAEIAMRFSKVDTEAQKIIGIAAVLGHHFTLDVLSTTANADSNSVFNAVLGATEARLLEPVKQDLGKYQFTHAMIQEFIAATMPPSEQRRYHLQVAKRYMELEEAGAEIEYNLLARHLAFALPMVSTEKVVNIALKATERAGHTGTPEITVDVLGLSVKALEGLPRNVTIKKQMAVLYHRLATAYSDVFLAEPAAAARRTAFELYKELGMIDEMVRVACTPISSRTSDRQIPISMHPTVFGSTDAYLIRRAQSYVEPGSLNDGYLGLHQRPFDLDHRDHIVAVAQQHDDLNLEMEAYAQGIQIIAHGTRSDTAWSDCQHVWDLWPQTRNDAACARALYWTATAARKEGNISKEWETLSRLEVLSDTTGDWHHRLLFLQQRCSLAKVSGDFACWKEASGGLLTFLDLYRSTWQYYAALRDGATISIYCDNRLESQNFLDRLKRLDKTPDLRWASHAALYARITGDLSVVPEVLDVIETVRSTNLKWYFIKQLLVIAQVYVAAATQDCKFAERILTEEDFENTKLLQPPGINISHPYQLQALVLDLVGQHEAAEKRFGMAVDWLRKANFVPLLGWVCFDYATSLMTQKRFAQAAVLIKEAESISSQTGMFALSRKLAELSEKHPELQVEAGKSGAMDSIKVDDVKPITGGLTPREAEILKELSYGYTNKEIGRKLNISPHTVTRHVQNMLVKTETSNRTELVAYAYDRKLLFTEPPKSVAGKYRRTTASG